MSAALEPWTDVVDTQPVSETVKDGLATIRGWCLPGKNGLTTAPLMIEWE